jgi:hypothetical protein
MLASGLSVGTPGGTPSQCRPSLSLPHPLGKGQQYLYAPCRAGAAALAGVRASSAEPTGVTLRGAYRIGRRPKAVLPGRAQHARGRRGKRVTPGGTWTMTRKVTTSAWLRAGYSSASAQHQGEVHCSVCGPECHCMTVCVSVGPCGEGGGGGLRPCGVSDAGEPPPPTHCWFPCAPQCGGGGWVGVAGHCTVTVRIGKCRGRGARETPTRHTASPSAWHRDCAVDILSIRTCCRCDAARLTRTPGGAGSRANRRIQPHSAAVPTSWAWRAANKVVSIEPARGTRVLRHTWQHKESSHMRKLDDVEALAHCTLARRATLLTQSGF